MASCYGHSLGVVTPAANQTKLMYPITSVTRVRLDQLTHRVDQWPILVHLPGDMTLRTPELSQHHARPAFTDLVMPQTQMNTLYRLSRRLGSISLAHSAVEAVGVLPP